MMKERLTFFEFHVEYWRLEKIIRCRFDLDSFLLLIDHILDSIAFTRYFSIRTNHQLTIEMFFSFILISFVNWWFVWKCFLMSRFSHSKNDWQFLRIWNVSKMRFSNVWVRFKWDSVWWIRKFKCFQIKHVWTVLTRWIEISFNSFLNRTFTDESNRVEMNSRRFLTDDWWTVISKC